jgi:cyclic beta-1,2-glucan synthetase
MSDNGDNGWLDRLRQRVRRGPLPDDGRAADEPIPSRVLSAAQMERHGRALARSHRLRQRSQPDRLLARVSANQAVLDRACTLLTEAVQAKRRLTPAGEWLLDNIYLIEEQISIARRHLPRGYSEELAQLDAGPSAGLPRVYDIVLHAIAHGDGRVDAESLSRYVAAYQSVAPLNLGELWAIPIMLRLALIDNLRRVAARLIADRNDRNVADLWSDRLTETAESNPKGLVLVIADMARSNPPASSSFVAELARRLQGRSAALAMPLTWVEQWLSDGEQSIEQMVHAENQQQAAAQVSISNSIGSLRFLATLDWREFVESISLVERTLREDPAGLYGRMDFATRDSYRHVVELVARRGRLAETQVADQVLALARAGAEREGTESLAAHVGHYVVGDGRRRLEAALPMRAINRRLRTTLRRLALPVYASSGAAIVAVFTWAMLGHAQPALAWPGYLVVAGLCVLAFSELAVALVNWSATLLVRPSALPRMDFGHGIPPEMRTLVVVPTMLGSAEGIRALAESLEVRFLANRDDSLHFALLTDLLDADAATVPGDAERIAAARQAIEQLNRRHAPAADDRFFLFHRPRLFNASEGVWMGHERKRGKLGALNAFLRGGETTPFSDIVGSTRILGNVRYVITLDTDTQLPRDGARELVATLAHPLNRARLDPQRRIITAGYGILQPRVGTSMSGQRRSRYAALFGSEPGIDPYTRAVSDVYHDLFGEGSFVGKGIYDIDAFEATLAGRMPDNRILSHDLLEGCYARAGLVSDVQLYEDYPGSYLLDIKRRHRWIRGDWQLLPWLLPRVPRPDGGRERNPLSLLSRGKLLDNLRRSLVPVATTALFLTGWLLSPRPAAWTLWLLAIVAMTPLVASIMDLFNRPSDLPLPAHLRHAGRAARANFAPAPLTLACLPFEAVTSLDAIGRSLWRSLVSKRHLLQWSPSSEVERTMDGRLATAVRTMWTAPALALATGAWLASARPEALPAALPILLLWTASPVLMWWLGRPRQRRVTGLDGEQRAFLGRIARRTWAWFQVNVGPADHGLPPDNVQEQPVAAIAHRTSPTNIGLSLLADLAAWDMGYLDAGGVAERCARTLATLESLPRHRGHFYNWYDTQTLEPLPPRYVSTVDSGNLAGHLLTLRQGLLALREAPVLAPCWLQGISDTVGVLAEEADPADAAAAAVLGRLKAALAGGCAQPPEGRAANRRLLLELRALAAELAATAAVAPPVAPALATDAAAWSWTGALEQQCSRWLAELDRLAPDAGDDAIPTLGEVARDAAPANAAASAHARDRIAELERLADAAARCAQMDQRFLYDAGRHLQAIGYNVDDDRLDPGYYDLLASEARLGLFVAIAQGELPQTSWFALGRLLTEVDGRATLLSWSGSMFEYLMPQLVMPSYDGTLLDQTARHAVQRQIAYGAQRDVPWGISESGYHLFDSRMNYQYRAFGVPGLGLKRGLSQDLVVAPYAAMMALMVAPEPACSNLQRMAALGWRGSLGFYEAIDYTPARLPRGQACAVVRSHMVHHQGMGLLAIVHLLRGQPMQQRFVADPQFQATLLLLQERVPRTGIFHPHSAEVAASAPISEVEDTPLRVFQSPGGARPAVQMLSNGRFHLLLTSAGGGYCRHGDIALTRWREDGTRDPWGHFCYLRDLDSGRYWSAAHQPTRVPVANYEAIFSDAKAEFRGSVDRIESHVEIAVSPEDDIELRRLRLINRSAEPRRVEITTYAEVVLAPAASDELHPAFSNLFVQTELVPAQQAILCTRRPRGHGEVPPFLVHLLAVHDADIDAISYETDRSAFIGRGRNPARPAAMAGDGPLSNSQGPVLDPIVAIRCAITLKPGQVAVVDMVTGIAFSRADGVGLIEKYRDRRLADRVFDLAWTHSQVVRRQINASQADAQLYERLAGLVVHAHPLLRAPPAVLLQNRRGQSGLWGQAISGDHPIVLVRIADVGNLDLVRQMVQAHAYWRLKGLVVDMVIWNEDQGGYRQELQDQILGLVAAGVEAHVIDRPGGIFVRAAQHLPQEDRILLQSVARVIIDDGAGSLADQVGRRPPAQVPVPAFAARPVQYPLLGESAPADALSGDADPVPADDRWPFADPVLPLRLGNGLGAFSGDGREYVIDLQPGAATPAPWANVLANARFGTVVSESAPGYTWAENAHAFRLTPWANDPVSDSGGEAYYLRDEETGRTWSPMPLPCPGDGAYRTRHGFGYSVYEHEHDGIASELWIYVDVDAAVKYCVLQLHNRSGRPRSLSAIGYAEWVLGDLPGRTRLHVVSEVDGDSQVLTARNPYNTAFEHRVAFFDVDPAGVAAPGRSHTGDRVEFLGRNGSLQQPAALRQERLSGRTGAGLDPCAALQVPLELEPGARSETVFRLGMGATWGDAVALAVRSRGSQAAHDALDAVRSHWLATLGGIQVQTPAPEVDVLANGWLLYQTIACRFLARSGYYQSGGAIGFRDQLQDSMAMLHAQPGEARAHLLACAAHQFPEGDVLHWWHPPTDRGVRTRCSDDFLWLPFVTARYLDVTADAGVLDEQVGYVEGRQVNHDEESYYDLPLRSHLREDLYGHCRRALQRGMRLLGERGLPLMATGDWNDGMNRVGEGGRGESVWLGFFLFATLERFADVADGRGDAAFAQTCRTHAAALQANLERHGWDGAWYRRAWFDNGAPLGSTQSDECTIDSISQSWSVLSGAGDPERSRQAMASLHARLVRPEAALVQLLDPPFDSTAQDPGYIRGYLPGVRENGGQYTHAALWATMAFAKLGDTATAWQLLDLINPVNHGRDAKGIATYKVEPYVVAADVYAVPPHEGRGGWSWYTGSAGWMYRLIVESLLGLQRSGSQLRLAPCMPAHWPEYRMQYRFGAATWRIRISAGGDAGPSLTVDGAARPDLVIDLVDDGRFHDVEYTTGPAAPAG